MKKNLVTIVLMAGALPAVFFLTFHLHQTSKEKVLSQFKPVQYLFKLMNIFAYKHEKSKLTHFY